MKVALFGASGATGQCVAAALLSEGVKVKALCRKADVMADFAGELTVIQGELDDKKAVSETLCGCDVAICVFGPRLPYTDIFCAEATAVIVESMHKLGVHRLICQTGAMVGDYPNNRSWAFQEMVDLFNHRYPALAADRSEQERIVRSSGLQWTILKPPRLTTGHVNEEIEVGCDLPVGVLSSASRETIAHWLIRELRHPLHIGETLFFLD
ncbi:MAG: hypothetical protein CO187_06685 [Zetaproteobacteria bacterium CG_4_9_14_3_um_filter_53_7]|nr:MAG: hypothetical protein CO187_06685 [Zetaproteobacteria bacterium CG_4_9_14_3_um_filter_53_7]